MQLTVDPDVINHLSVSTGHVGRRERSLLMGGGGGGVYITVGGNKSSFTPRKEGGGGKILSHAEGGARKVLG